MTEDAGMVDWPRRGSRTPLIARQDRADLSREWDELRDAIGTVHFADGTVATVVTWALEQADDPGKLSDMDDVQKAVAAALRQAGHHDDAARLRWQSSTGEDAVSPTCAALIGQAAVDLIRVATDRQGWKIVTNLRRGNHRFASAVAETLQTALRQDHAFLARFLKLAREIVDEAAAFPERDVPSFERDVFTRMLERWRRTPDLKELWFGLRGQDPIFHGVGSEVLGIVARVAPVDAAALLDRFDQPFSVQAALRVIDVERSFDTWRSLIRVAPVAFRSDASWTGSMLLPLLLVSAMRAIGQGTAPHARFADSTEAETAGLELTEAAEAAATVLLSREDGPQAALRWAAWLARSLTVATIDGPAIPRDARDRAFAPWRTLCALAEQAGATAWTSLAPPDARHGEAWFIMMARVVSIDGSRAQPAVRHLELSAAFLDWWPEETDYEAWTGAKGRALRDASEVLRTAARRPTTLGVRLLSLPMSMGADPLAAWNALWRRCFVLRDRLEFGDWQHAGSPDETSPWRAAELCWLAVDVGLCIIDQLADERIVLCCDRRATAAGILAALWKALSEMFAIDRFKEDLGQSERRHLILRRALFATDQHDARFPALFSPSAVPNLEDMLRDAAAIDHDFFATLLALVDAGLPNSELRDALLAAGIDLRAMLLVAERANAVDDRRPVLEPYSIERLHRVSG